MAITTEAGYVTAKANAQVAPVLKASLANMAAGIQASLWRATGLPTQPAIPGAAAVVDRTTVGGILLKALTTGDTRYLDGFVLNCANAGALCLCDRLLHMGGLNGTLTTAQNVNTPALPTGRCDANGADVEWWLEWYTDTGGTAVTATVNVTCDDNSTPNVSVSLAATRRAGMMLPIIPPTGRTIKAVNTVTLSATTGAAGSFGVTATKPVGVMAGISVANVADRAESLLVPIHASSCLMLRVDCSTTSTGQVVGAVRMIEG